MYRREWDEDTAPIVVPDAKSGGFSGWRRFEHRAEHSNDSMSSLRLRMSSLEIAALQNIPQECMMETGWYCCPRPREGFEGGWHAEWKSLPCAKEDVMDACMMSALRKSLQ